MPAHTHPIICAPAVLLQLYYVKQVILLFSIRKTWHNTGGKPSLLVLMVEIVLCQKKITHKCYRAHTHIHTCPQMRVYVVLVFPLISF